MSLLNYISVTELIDTYEVSQNTILKSIQRFRNNNKSKSWENIKHPNDGRMVLIKIDTIPERTRLKHKIPTAQEWEDIQKYREYQHNKDQEDFNIACYKESLIDAYNNNWLVFKQQYKAHFKTHKDKENLSNAYAKEHAFWCQLVDLSGGIANRAKRNSLNVLYDIYRELRLEIPYKIRYTDYKSFAGKVNVIRKSLFKNEDIKKQIVSNQYFLIRNKKTTHFHKGMALYYLSHPKIYPYRVVTDLVNYHAKQEKKQLITESWVKKLMATDREFKTIVEKGRYGKKYFSDNIASYIPRKISPFPANVWMIDGTPMQFYCWNKERKKLIRLYLFTVIDVCTRKIVGFDVGLSEDRFMVANALKMAVNRQGHLPSEIVSDNFSANKTEEIKDLKEQMLALGTLWRNAKVGNAQDKSYAERFYGAFQSISCALYDDYIGEGITSKRKNARPNKEYLAEIARKKGYAGYDEMQLRICKMIDHYNQKETSVRKAPNKLYKELPKPHAIELDLYKTALLFWKKTAYTVRRSMVIIQVNKLKYFYEIKDHKLKATLHESTLIVRYDESDLSQVTLFNKETNEPICECKQKIEVNIGNVDRTELDEIETLKQIAKKKSFSNFLDRKALEILSDAMDSVDKSVKDFEQVHPLKIAKEQMNSNEDESFMNYYSNIKNINKELANNTEDTIPQTEPSFLKEKTQDQIHNDFFTRKKAPKKRA